MNQITLNGSGKQADIRGYIGATGTGKTTLMMNGVNELKPKQLLVWDYKREFNLPSTNCVESLLDIMFTDVNQSIVYAFHCDQANEKIRLKQFQVFCESCLELAKQSGDVTVLVDELKFVTNPTKSSPGWDKIILTGRDAGVRILAATQRPAHCDKDFISNCTELNIFNMAYEDDRVNCAKAMPDVKQEDLQSSVLPDYHFLRYGKRHDGIQRLVTTPQK